MYVLITTPAYDDPTHYLRAWTRVLVEDIKEKELDVKLVQLDQKEATRTHFEDRIKAHNPVFVLINGHGNPDKLYGSSHKEVLLEAGKNDSLMADKIVYARSCDSLGGLGKSCVQNGAKAYIGYKSGFWLLYDGNMLSRAKEDKISKPFMEVSNAIPWHIIRGHEVRQAIEKSKEKLKEWEEYYKTHYDMDADHILTFLRLDMSFQDVEGNKNATIFS